MCPYAKKKRKEKKKLPLPNRPFAIASAITRVKNDYPATLATCRHVRHRSPFFLIFPARSFYATCIYVPRTASAKCISFSFSSVASFIFDSAWDSPRFFLKATTARFRGKSASATSTTTTGWPPLERGGVAAATRARSWMGRQGGCQHRATNGDRFRVWVRQGRSPSGAARETPRIVARLSMAGGVLAGCWIEGKRRGVGEEGERARDTPFCWVQCTLVLLRVQNRCSGLPQLLQPPLATRRNEVPVAIPALTLFRG